MQIKVTKFSCTAFASEFWRCTGFYAHVRAPVRKTPEATASTNRVARRPDRAQAHRASQKNAKEWVIMIYCVRVAHSVCVRVCDTCCAFLLCAENCYMDFDRGHSAPPNLYGNVGRRRGSVCKNGILLPAHVHAQRVQRRRYNYSFKCHNYCAITHAKL